MTKVDVVADAAAGASPPDQPDERLAYRGVFQRLLIMPEVGAALGAIAIWGFFWAVTVPFGTSGGTANWLDVAATLGIMAVAVSLLMIGGEFDLSAGAMTGTMGLLVIIMVKETGELGGAGLSLWIALPASFLVAMAIGWANGTMVERTGLPSFIVTLGTFFVLKGVKLGFAKLIVDQIQVGRIDEGAGYAFWRNVFASTWQRNDHQFEARDFFYTTLVVLGVALLVVAVHELTYRRAVEADPAGLVLFLLGLAVTVVSYILLHTTDGVGSNWVLGIVLSMGVIGGLYGLSRWRYTANPDRGTLRFPADVVRMLALGAALVILGVVAGVSIDSTSDRTVGLLFTVQGVRAILMVGLAGGGLVALLVAAARAEKVSSASKSAGILIAAGTVVALAFVMQFESESKKFRAELFTVMLVVALLMAAWAIVGYLFEPRRFSDAAADVWAKRMVAVAVTMIVVGFVIRLLFTTMREIDLGLAEPANFSIRIMWFIAFTAVASWVLVKTKFGSWTFAVGGNKEASRETGVPAARTKTQLFMIVAGAAWLVGMLLAFRLNTLQSGTGDGLEFEYIIAAVVGGTLLIGGYGSALGGAIGALIMAMSSQGIPFAGWNSDWRFVFLGVILLLAVIANRFIRTSAESARRVVAAGPATATEEDQ